MSAELLARLRADTPSCEHIIHFNNAGSALMPDPVFETVAAYLQTERVMGGYEAEVANAAVLARFYDGFATLLGAKPHEIAYLESATRAWDSVFYGLNWQTGDEVIIHQSDYGSNQLSYLQMQQRRGIVVRHCASDASGQIDVAALQAMIGPRTRLVCLSHVPTQGGMVNPAAEVGRVTRTAGVLYLLDACQSLGQVPVNVADIGCDFLSGTGRKFLRGPRGTGVLYVGSHALKQLDPPFIDGHAAHFQGKGYAWEHGARRFEAFERNCAGMAGLGRAVDYLLDLGVEAVTWRIAALAATLRTALAAVPGVSVHDLGVQKAGIVTFSKAGEPAAAIIKRLAASGINTSLSHAHWAPIDFAARKLPDMVRASVHAYNSEAEVARMVAVLAA